MYENVEKEPEKHPDFSMFFFQNNADENMSYNIAQIPTKIDEKWTGEGKHQKSLELSFLRDIFIKLSTIPSSLIFCQFPLRFTQHYITFLDISFIELFFADFGDIYSLLYNIFIISFQLTFRKYPGSNGSAIRQKIRSMVRVPREVFGRKRRSSGKKSEIYSTFDSHHDFIPLN